MIKSFNPVKSRRPWPPISISHIFQQGPFSSWPLLFLHLGCFCLDIIYTHTYTHKHTHTHTHTQAYTHTHTHTHTHTQAYTHTHFTHNIHNIEKLLTLYSNVSILCISIHYISSYTLVYSCVTDHSIIDYEDIFSKS